MTRCRCTVFLCALLSFPVHSGTVSFLQWIPWDFLKAELKENSFHYVEDIPVWEVNAGDLRPRLLGVNSELQGKVESLTSSGGNIHLEVRGSLSLSVSRILVDQVIERVIGGNVLRVRVEASCSPITLVVRDFSLGMNFNLASGHPVISGLGMEIPPGSWELSDFRCEGISGGAEDIRLRMETYFRNPRELSALLSTWVRPWTNNWIEAAWVKLPEDSRVEAWDDGLLIRGKLKTSGVSDVEAPLPMDLDDSLPKLLISRRGFEEIVLSELRTILPKIYDLREVAEFRKLQASRFLQTFAWPDLRKFHPATPFIIRPDPENLRLELKGQGDVLQVNIGGTGSLVTLIGGSPIDYAVWSMSGGTTLSVGIDEGLVIRTGEGKFAIAAEYGFLYQRLYRPSGKLPKDLLARSLGALFSRKIFRARLPEFRLGERLLRHRMISIDESTVSLGGL